MKLHMGKKKADDMPPHLRYYENPMLDAVVNVVEMTPKAKKTPK